MLRSSERYTPLKLAERCQIFAPVVQLGGPWVSVIRHALGGLQGAAILQEHGDTGAPEGVIADALREFGSRAAILDKCAAYPAGRGRPVSLWFLSSV